MKVTSIKTHKITVRDKNILNIIDQYVTNLRENSVVAVTSKIVSICEGSVVRIGSVDKDELIKRQAQYFLPRSSNKYNVALTIKKDTLIASSGIDESNGNGYYVLWPKDAQKSANAIRSHLKRRCDLNNLGVIITDSKTAPMRWGVTAIAIAYCGFNPLKSYVGKKDLFGRPFAFEKLSIIDNLASAAALVMGEGAEQAPIAIIENVPRIQFQDRNPTEKELQELKISMEEDLYAPLLKSVKWKRGRD